MNGVTALSTMPICMPERRVDCICQQEIFILHFWGTIQKVTSLDEKDHEASMLSDVHTQTMQNGLFMNAYPAKEYAVT